MTAAILSQSSVWLHAFNKWAARKLSPLLLLTSRLLIAKIFWYSGLSKCEAWESTIMLFEEEYQTPFLSPEFAAYTATAFELLCPVLLVLGLMTRLAALPLLMITLVIQFTYMDLEIHYFWAILLGFLMAMGPGKFSVDYLLERHLKRMK